MTVLHTAVQQGLLEFSKKRARVRADSNGLVGDAKLVAIEGSSLEIRDFGNIKFKAANLCLALLGTGVHSAITCREEDEKVSVKGANNQFSSVTTGKKIPAGFKGIDYNMHTVIRFYRDEDNNVMANVMKDRTGVHPNEILSDPTLLDWQVVIDGNKGRQDFVLKNSLDTAVQTEQEIYSAEVLSNAAKSMSKSDMEKVMNNNAETETSSSTKTPKELIAEINTLLKPVPLPEKQAIRAKIKEANLPDSFARVTDVEILNKILEIVKSNL